MGRYNMDGATLLGSYSDRWRILFIRIVRRPLMSCNASPFLSDHGIAGSVSGVVTSEPLGVMKKRFRNSLKLKP